FDFAAEVGLTKHFGGLEGTQELAALCYIDERAYVLDVGCGAGVTPCFLARRYGCRVVGIDIRARMMERSAERARRERVADRVEFRVADAQDLPFDDGLFDAVITESVTCFPEDKQRAVNEYVRVARPGGYVGLAEATWLKVPPPLEVVAWASQDVGASVQPLPADEWVRLMETAGLTEIEAQVRPVETKKEAGLLVRRYGYGGVIGSALRALALYARNPAYRRFVKSVKEGGIVPKNLAEYFGYGLYVGRKQAAA
ncbi:MAG: methyltransferase domain-containing protein, partial [Anaerolineales bacterium]|nr:methyltransferase domain-containing protein [Anaerolineales bacterium]